MIETPMSSAYELDPVTMQIISNRVSSIARGMLTTLIRASYSPNIKQRGDCSAAILGVEGQILAQAPGAPVHLGSMLGTVSSLLRRYPLDTLRPGDMYVANDPYTAGGQHLPDINVVAPVFVGDTCAAFVANVAHHADIGGMVPGSESAACQSIYQEGLRLPPVRLVREGQIVSDIVAIVLLNSRTPEEREGDLRAQIASNNVGLAELLKTFGKYGQELMKQWGEAYLQYTERRFQSSLSEMPSGSFSAEDFMDLDPNNPEEPRVRVALALERRASRLLLDFTGTGNQVGNAFNAPLNAVLSTVYVLVKNFLAPDLPANSGYFRAVEVIAPTGSLLNPRPPAATSSRIFACAIVGDVLASALSKAFPERSLSSSAPHCHVNFSGQELGESPWVDYETIAGAYGARAYRDGMDAVRIHMSGTLNLPIEILERNYPFLVERYALRVSSSGHGQYRGGAGVIRDYRILSDMTVSVSGQRLEFGPPGLAGGMSGMPAEFVVHSHRGDTIRLPASVTLYPLKAGDVVSVRSAGGGGYGNPHNRDPKALALDLRDGRISQDVARSVYARKQNETR